MTADLTFLTRFFFFSTRSSTSLISSESLPRFLADLGVRVLSLSSRSACPAGAGESGRRGSSVKSLHVSLSDKAR